MIQIPLERLLERIADQVGSAQLAEDADPYDRAQLRAAAEILRNLAPRVQWRGDDTDAEAIHRLLAPAGRGSPADPQREIARLYGELSARDDAEAVAVREAIEELAGRKLERELGNLRR